SRVSTRNLPTLGKVPGPAAVAGASSPSSGGDAPDTSPVGGGGGCCGDGSGRCEGVPASETISGGGASPGASASRSASTKARADGCRSPGLLLSCRSTTASALSGRSARSDRGGGGGRNT